MPFGIGANLVEQEAIGATQILLITQAKAIGKRVRFLLIAAREKFNRLSTVSCRARGGGQCRFGRAFSGSDIQAPALQHLFVLAAGNCAFQRGVVAKPGAVTRPLPVGAGLLAMLTTRCN